MKYIGIDPGKKGFISVLEIFDLPEWKFYPIPTIKGKVIDVVELNNIFEKIKGDCHAVIEKVHAIYGSSAKATFDFGFTAGLLEGMLIAHSIPYTKVPPKEWQKEMWQGVQVIKKTKRSNDTKAMSEIAVKRLFPKLDLRKTERCTTNDDNKVDSILMAEYCRRKFK